MPGSVPDPLVVADFLVDEFLVDGAFEDDPVAERVLGEVDGFLGVLFAAGEGFFAAAMLGTYPATAALWSA